MNVNFFPKRLLRKLRNRPTAWRESTNDRLDGFETLEDRVLLSGTPQLVADILPGVGSSRPIRATYVNSTLFFQANDGTTGGELWKSDGTNAGTVLVKDIQPGIASSNPSSLTNVNGTLFFEANNGSLVGTGNGTELWKSDGTNAGTVLVKHFYPGLFGSYYGYGLSIPVAVNGTLFFTAFDDVNGRELWKSDGTAAGTVLVKDINPGAMGSEPNRLTDVNGTLFFGAFNSNNEGELWKSDGTSSGTVRVKESPITGFNSLINFNGSLFFTANEGVHGKELWRSDGTDAGTVLVKDIRAGAPGSSPRQLTNVNGKLFFTANESAYGVELWQSDGTVNGTVLVKEFDFGSYENFGPIVSRLTDVNGELFFRVHIGDYDSQLWKSDGTNAGTLLVKDFDAGSQYNLSYLTSVNGTLFFSADDGVHGTELWQSDGTSAGTVLVADINPGVNNSNPMQFINAGGTLFFTANNGINGIELYKLGMAVQNNPVFTSSNIAAIDENSTTVMNLTVANPNTITFSITNNGTDNSFFEVVNGNRLRFKNPPDFETPLDADVNNVYDVQVQADDGNGGIATQTIHVTVLNLASITGSVFVDVNRNGQFDANEPGLDGVVVELRDANGVVVRDENNQPIKAITSVGGFLLFEDLAPGTYQLHELQPSGVSDGDEVLGSIGGIKLANDVMQLNLERTDARDYNFIELGQSVTSGDTASIGFWQNKHGQALINAGGNNLAVWLSTNFTNVFGNVFSTTSVADFYRNNLFNQKSAKSAGPAKVDAQFMAVALATYFTNNHLAGNVATSYGFTVTDTGIGTKIVNVGNNGAAFDAANSSNLTIMQLLVATNTLTDRDDRLSGAAAIYDRNGNGIIDANEAALRTMANTVYSSINEAGDI